jgi:hypothetical protein
VSAAEALKAARDAGIGLHVDGDGLVLEASGPPPDAVLDLLSGHKAGVIALLREEKHVSFSAITAAAPRPGSSPHGRTHSARKRVRWSSSAPGAPSGGCHCRRNTSPRRRIRNTAPSGSTCTGTSAITSMVSAEPDATGWNR